MATTPLLTDDQRNRGTRLAITARIERAQLRKMIREGEISVAAVFDDAEKNPTGPAARMRPLELLLAVPGITEGQAHGILTRARVRPQRRLRGLGHRQRDIIIEATTPGT